MKIILKGVPPYDGAWHIGASMDDWTNREWAIIKRVSGATPLTLEEAMVGGDITTFVALAIMGLHRSGRFARVDEDVLWNATSACFDFDPEEAQAGDGEPADPNAVSGPSADTTLFGSPSPNGSESPAPIPFPTGTPSSDTWESRPTRSAG